MVKTKCDEFFTIPVSCPFQRSLVLIWSLLQLSMIAKIISKKRGTSATLDIAVFFTSNGLIWWTILSSRDFSNHVFMSVYWPKYAILALSWRRSYHIETSPLIYRVNQWTGFYMIETSVMKELNWVLATQSSKNKPGILLLNKNKISQCYLVSKNVFINASHSFSLIDISHILSYFFQRAPFSSNSQIRKLYFYFYFLKKQPQLIVLRKIGELSSRITKV